MRVTDRQTDRRTDRITNPKTALAYARAVKMQVLLLAVRRPKFMNLWKNVRTLRSLQRHFSVAFILPLRTYSRLGREIVEKRSKNRQFWAQIIQRGPKLLIWLTPQDLTEFD